MNFLFPFAGFQGGSLWCSKEEGYKEEYFPYPICKEPTMHQLLVDVALGGAQAFNQSQRPARMSHNVLLRIDIALTWHGDQVTSLPCSLLLIRHDVRCRPILFRNHGMTAVCTKYEMLSGAGARTRLTCIP